MGKNCVIDGPCVKCQGVSKSALAAKRPARPHRVSDDPVRAFLVTTVLFATIPSVSLAMFYYCNREFIPAYRVTNSYSFNEKIGWLPASARTDVLTIGSSMSLNNISSSVLTAGLGTRRYLNAGAWGTKIEDINRLLPVFVKLYRPSIVICASNVMDFSTSSIEYDIEAVEREVTKKSSVTVLHLLYRYYLVHTVDNRTNLRSRAVYSSLCFDDWGGIPFAEDGFDVKPVRWNRPLRCDTINDESYEALSEVSRYLKTHGILFIFVHTPSRASLQNAVNLAGTCEHVAKVRQLLEGDGHLVVDLSRTICPDCFFADSVHLNRRGADSITQMVIAAYNQSMTQ